MHPVGMLLERMTRILFNDAHVASLKPAQWEVLRYLHRANRFSRTPSAVTQYLGLTKGTVSQTLNALVRKGLVEKHVDPCDRRTVHLKLTAAGKKAILNDPSDVFDVAINALSEKQAAALASGLTQVLLHTLRKRGARVFDPNPKKRTS